MLTPLLDLTRQSQGLKPQFHRVLEKILRDGIFILGSEVRRFEEEFARFCGSRYGVGVASGTDALELSLRALGVGSGDLVATVSFTFLATVDAILHVGASPLFIDIDPVTFTMDPVDLERHLKQLSPSTRGRVKAVIPVHLFGHPCDMTEILRIARRYRLNVIEDCAQAAGAKWGDQPVGSLGEVGCFSFFPSKNLGAFGDGGIVVTNSARLARRLRLLRIHGREKDDRQVLLGRNSRLDELQAAILRVKLKRLPRWVNKRRRLATRYTRLLLRLEQVQCPRERPGATHAFCLYVIRTPRRKALRKWLNRRGIATAIYYPLPVHRQPLHRKEFRDAALPETEKACREVLALPLFPELSPRKLRRAATEITHFFRASAAVSATVSPMAREAVAAGEGALRT